LALGKSIREIEAFDQDEIAEWQLYLSEHPLPNHWEIGAQISCLIYNTAMGTKKRLRIDDFLPRKRKKKIDPNEAKAALGGI